MSAMNRTCTTSRTTPPSCRMRWPLAFLAAFIAFSLAPRADALEPCCSITAIDLRTGLATARVNVIPAGPKNFKYSIGYKFQFAVTDRVLLNSLKVGQAVHTDFATMKVSVRLDRSEPCCSIVTPPTPLR